MLLGPLSPDCLGKKWCKSNRYQLMNKPNEWENARVQTALEDLDFETADLLIKGLREMPHIHHCGVFRSHSMTKSRKVLQTEEQFLSGLIMHLL